MDKADDSSTEIRSLDDVVRVLGHGQTIERTVATYRAFNVTYRDDYSCTVQIGFWNPLRRRFTPDKQLVLREDALSLLIDQLQSQHKRIAKPESWTQYIKRILKAR